MPRVTITLTDVAGGGVSLSVASDPQFPGAGPFSSAQMLALRFLVAAGESAGLITVPAAADAESDNPPSAPESGWKVGRSVSGYGVCRTCWTAVSSVHVVHPCAKCGRGVETRSTQEVVIAELLEEIRTLSRNAGHLHADSQ